MPPIDCHRQLPVGDVATAGHRGQRGPRSKEDLEGGADG